MPNITRKITLPSLAIIVGTLQLPALAEDRWFRVELMIFANEIPPVTEGAATPEQWDPTPVLAYPTASRFLVDPERVVSNAAEYEGASVVDEYGRQIITLAFDGDLPDDALIFGNSPELGTQGDNTPTDVDDSPAAPVPVKPTPVYQGGVPEGVTVPGAAPAAPEPLLLPDPFVLLPVDYLEFAGKAALMQRRGDYSLLFHQSWVQPVTGASTSLPIVLDHSGDTLQWPQLQGTIDIYLSRYLHLETNLWLNTAGSYLPGSWQMPAPPFGPPSLIIEEQQIIDIATAVEGLPATIPNAEGATDELEEFAGDAALDAEADASLQSEPGAVAGEEELIANDPNAPVEAAEPIYPYRHAVLLDQTRRMRSDEVHYIDHPLLGVVVKFTPVTAEELDLIARAQQPAEDATQPE